MYESEKEANSDSCYCIQLLNSFVHFGPNGKHFAMVFEILGVTLLEIIKRYNYRGVPLPLVRIITKQVLIGLDYLHRICNIIHTDLKPENVLVCLTNDELNEIIDQGQFGNPKSHYNYETNPLPREVEEKKAVVNNDIKEEVVNPLLLKHPSELTEEEKKELKRQKKREKKKRQKKKKQEAKASLINGTNNDENITKENVQADKELVETVKEETKVKIENKEVNKDEPQPAVKPKASGHLTKRRTSDPTITSFGSTKGTWNGGEDFPGLDGDLGNKNHSSQSKPFIDR